MIASVDRLFTVPVQRDTLGVRRTGGGMSGGDGVDLGQVLAMLGDLLVGQRGMQEAIRAVDRRVDDLAGQVASLREAVDSYHAAVVGHGMLITELDERLRRVEQERDSPP